MHPGQGRLDGAFCDYDEKKKMTYLQHMFDLGVRNIEMEAACFAAFTKRAGIKCTCGRR
jgi:uridine phosphorylase